jgi:hypothetical protein
MYGLVNQAIEDLALQLGGPDLWARIRHGAGVDVEAFIGMQAYPDDVTYRLVDAASAELGIPAASVLEAFGKHWILYTARNGYGPLLQTMGSTLPEFLGNLDAMHARITLSMPDLRPPSFVCETLPDGRLTVEYWSDRDGLAPMVRGLLIGLGEMLAAPVSVSQTTDRTSGADHDEFLIAYLPNESAVDHEVSGPLVSHAP